jgi:hypothetical protein
MGLTLPPGSLFTRFDHLAAKSTKGRKVRYPWLKRRGLRLVGSVCLQPTQ